MQTNLFFKPLVHFEIYSRTYSVTDEFQSGILARTRTKLEESLEAVSSYHPEDDLEVLGPEHFTLPAGFLLAGLSAAFILLLAEILVQKYAGKKVPAEHKPRIDKA